MAQEAAALDCTGQTDTEAAIRTPTNRNTAVMPYKLRATSELRSLGQVI